MMVNTPEDSLGSDYPPVDTDNDNSLFVTDVDQLRRRIGRHITLDGTVADTIKGMTGILSERSSNVCSWGCRALMNLARSDNDIPLRADALGAFRFLFEAVSSIQQFAERSFLVLEHGCASCSNLSRSDLTQSLLGECGAIQVILCKLRQLLGISDAEPATNGIYDNDKLEDAISYAVEALARLCTNHEVNVDRAAEHDAFACCRAIMFRYGENATLLKSAFALLENLVSRADRCIAAHEDGLLPVIVEALFRHASVHIGLAEAGCRLLVQLAKCENNRLHLLALNVISVLITILETHKDHTNAILYACWAIVELSVTSDFSAFWKDQDHQERFKAPTDSDSEEDNEDSELQLRRLSVVSGPFEGPTVYEPENQLKEELTRQEQDFEEIIISILKNMRKHKENEDVYRYGTAALENIASRSDRLRVEIAVRNGVQIITSGMKVHLENPSVISNACHALAVLAASDSTMHQHITTMRGMTYTLQAMRLHTTEEEVQFNACRLLANLALTENVREELIRRNGVDAGITSLTNHPEHVDVLCNCFKLLENICVSGHARQTLIESNRVKSICFRGMRVNADDADLQLLGIRLLECLCYNEHKHVLSSCESIAVILHALRTHIHHADVVSVAIHALMSLALNSANRQAMISDRCHLLLLSILKKWNQNDGIIRYTCVALGNLAFKSDKTRQALLAAGTAKAMCAIIKSHGNTPEVSLAACATLRNLSAHASSHRRAVVDAGAVDAIKGLLDLHANNTSITYWSFGILNNISREPSLRRELVRAGWIEACISMMSVHAETSLSYQAAYELWSRLPKTKKQSELGKTRGLSRDSIYEMDVSEILDLTKDN
eukprot:gene1754-4867_t